MTIDWQTTVTALSNATATGIDATVRGQLVTKLQTAGQAFEHFSAGPVVRGRPGVQSQARSAALRDIDQAAAAVDGGALTQQTSDRRAYEAAVLARLRSALARPNLTAAQRVLLEEFSKALASLLGADPKQLVSPKPFGSSKTYAELEADVTNAIEAANLWLSING